ncbi:hypothetical protein, partial [Fusobacterium necrophorum]|uniref:hypothetical protein n=1 Tax=Fusobacterium necrophorum TaxID=859 RepID=UPI00164D44F0
HIAQPEALTTRIYNCVLGGFGEKKGRKEGRKWRERERNKKEDWQQMLAQGQSSSAKRRGLAADVSSGLIFLKKKNI